jgi:hypothetical protein
MIRARACGPRTLLAGAVGAAMLATLGSAGAAPEATRVAGVPAEAVAAKRLEAISRAYLGVPYRLDCLGEGSGIDPDPPFRRDYADCQTLVEQVMSEAIAPWVGGLRAAGERLRYRNGQVSFARRLHYCDPDWLEVPWPVRDVTAQVGGKQARTYHRRIDLPAFLARRGATGEAAPVGVRSVTGVYVPRGAVSKVRGRIPEAAIVVFVTRRPDMVAAHLGFLFRREGALVLRHASQTHRRVIEEPLESYLRREPRSTIGLKVLQPDVKGLGRATDDPRAGAQ